MPARKTSNRGRVLALVQGRGRIFENPYLRSLALAGLFAVVFFLLLNFSGVLPLSRLFFAPSGLPPKLERISTEFGLSCPVAKESCRDGKVVDFNGNPALSYKLEVGSSVFAVAPAVDSKKFSTDPFEKNAYRGFWQTTALGEDCYTVTYLLPEDSGLRIAPLAGQGETIGTLGKSMFKVDGEEVNLVLMIQKRKIAQSSGPGSQICRMGTLQPREFGEYLIVDSAVFQ